MTQRKRSAGMLFWLFLFISPLLDLLSGIRMYLLCGGSGQMLSSLDIQDLPGVSPSMVVRLLFLAAMLVFLWLHGRWKPFRVVIPIAVCCVLTAAAAHISGAEENLSAEFTYVARYCYCILVFLTYTALYGEVWTDAGAKAATDRILCAAQALLSLGVLIPFLFGIGFYTYADPLGYRGCRGFFFAGNDITAALLLLMPLTIVRWLDSSDPGARTRAVPFGVVNGLSLAAMLLIGTKTSFLALVVTFAAFLVYGLCLFFSRRQLRPLLHVAAVPAAAALILLLMRLIGRIDPFQTILGSIRGVENYVDLVDMENGRGLETVLLSGRTATLRTAWADFVSRLPVSALVGIGRGTQARIIEMDLPEVLLYYGALGAASMLWLYLKNGFLLLRDLLHNFSAGALAGLLSLCLGAGYLFAAGHVLFSVTAGFFFSFVMVYARAFLLNQR